MEKTYIYSRYSKEGCGLLHREERGEYSIWRCIVLGGDRATEGQQRQAGTCFAKNLWTMALNLEFILSAVGRLWKSLSRDFHFDWHQHHMVESAKNIDALFVWNALNRQIHRDRISVSLPLVIARGWQEWGMGSGCLMSTGFIFYFF